MRTNRHVLSISNAFLSLYNCELTDTDTKLIIAALAVDMANGLGDALLDTLAKDEFKELVLTHVERANAELNREAQSA